MPEGDTIFKIAQYLDAALRGRVVAITRLARLAPAPADLGPVTGVASAGKHLMIQFANGAVLRSHLGLYGSWHQYPRGALWQKPRPQASIVLESGEQQYVCFNAREVAWSVARRPAVLEARRDLGPDLIRSPPSLETLLARLDRFSVPQRLLVDLLLDQRIAAGIGNVYKSELLFLEGVSPGHAVGDTDAGVMFRLYLRASALLRANLHGGPRRTRWPRTGDRPGNELLWSDQRHHWVYGRKDRPCWRCGTPLSRAELGQDPRVTFWCAFCQPGPV